MKSKRLLTVVSLLLMVLSSSAVMFAQEPSKVSGRVLDEDGNPLVGAFVSAKGTNAGTVTDVDGNFTLSVPVGSKVLLFSMLGQQEKELPYEVGKTWYQVVLMSDTQMIEETVVVGYGTMIKRELTSSVSSVNGTELSERASAANVLQSMAGKMAGVQITSTSGRPGGNTRIRVRGMGSINASSSPLYVVDGVVDVDPNMINSSDIENIDVLKDAAAQEAAIRELEKIELIRQSDRGYRMDYAVTATQKEILKAFNMTAANIKTQAAAMNEDLMQIEKEG